MASVPDGMAPPTAPVSDRHNAIMARRASLAQAVADMAADMDQDTARVVIGADGHATVYVKSRAPNGKMKLHDYAADLVDLRGGVRP